MLDVRSVERMVLVSVALVVALGGAAGCGDEESAGGGGGGGSGGMGGACERAPQGPDGMLAELPAPSGPYVVGTHVRRLTDTNRDETATADPNDKRSIVLQLWYPADPCAEGPWAPWFEVEVGDALVASSTGALFDNPPPAGWSELVVTHAQVGVPMVANAETFPVVIASHGVGGLRNAYASIYLELASHGYVVASIQHPHDSLLTVFPDNGEQVGFDSEVSVDTSATLGDQHIAIWVEDAIFTLDQLEALNASDPDGLVTARLDMSAIGMLGHSYGGAATAEACFSDPRLDAGLNIDGTFFGPARTTGGRTLTQPFMLMKADWVAPIPTWDNLLGPGYQVSLPDVTHSGFTDYKTVSIQAGGIPAALDSAFGALDGERVIEIMRAYILALFEEHLRGNEQALLNEPDGTSANFSEVTFSSK